MNGYYLGIDTSCYTTSIACVEADAEKQGIVLDERTVLSVPLGGRGLRQSDALFQHNRNLPVLLDRLFASVDPKRIAAVAVSAAPTAEPDSYMPVFLAGKLAAKAVAGALSVPLVETTHQSGHVRAALFGHEPLLKRERFLAVHLSGGTTDLLSVRTNAAEKRFSLEKLGQANDLHAGQFVDRVGVALGLPFPCGRHLEKLAAAAEDRSIRIPSSVRGLDCSLSGAETRAVRLIEDGVARESVAFAVYDCLSRTLAKLLKHAAETTDCADILLSGGVASSRLLSELLSARIGGAARLWFSRSTLASDNAVGTALLAADRAAREDVCRA